MVLGVLAWIADAAESASLQSNVNQGVGGTNTQGQAVSFNQSFNLAVTATLFDIVAWIITVCLFWFLSRPF